MAGNVYNGQRRLAWEWTRRAFPSPPSRGRVLDFLPLHPVLPSPPIQMEKGSSTLQVAPSDHLRSERYYFRDGDVVLLVSGAPTLSSRSLRLTIVSTTQVENTLYRLHSSMLRRRVDIFNGLDIRGQTQQLQPAPIEGSDDQHPIRPPQVTKSEWEHLPTTST